MHRCTVGFTFGYEVELSRGDAHSCGLFENRQKERERGCKKESCCQESCPQEKSRS